MRITNDTKKRKSEWKNLKKERWKIVFSNFLSALYSCINKATLKRKLNNCIRYIYIGAK